MATKEAQNMVDIRLDSPRTPEGATQMPPFSNGAGAGAADTATSGTEGKPYLRFYSPGPKSELIICPLCKEKAATKRKMPTNFLDSLNSCLCCLSWYV